MANEFEKIAGDVLNVVEWPFKELTTANKIISTALADSPALQQAVTGLVSKVEQLATDASTAVAGDGINLNADVLALAQAKELYAYTTGTFIPAVKKAIADVEAAAKTAPAAATKSAAAKPAKATKPAPVPAPAASPAAASTEVASS
jgi:hypothetical protein